jgi:hypothetical protein
MTARTSNWLVGRFAGGGMIPLPALPDAAFSSPAAVAADCTKTRTPLAATSLGEEFARECSQGLPLRFTSAARRACTSQGRGMLVRTGGCRRWRRGGWSWRR